MKILLVEDEAKIADFVCAGFKERGWADVGSPTTAGLQAMI